MSNRKKSRLRDKYAQLRRETNKASRGGRVHDAAVQRYLEAIKNILGAGGDDPEMHYPTGEANDRVLINWYKRERDYPRLFGSRPGEGFERTVVMGNGQQRLIERSVDARNFLRTNEPTTRGRSEEPTRTAHFFTEAELRALGATETEQGNQRLPPEARVGGDVQNFGQPTVGVFEIDHVKDLNLGGDPGSPSERVLTNLWPLSGSANRAGNATQNQQVVIEMVQDEAGQWQQETEPLTDGHFDNKHVRAVAGDEANAQRIASTDLLRRPGLIKRFRGTNSDPFQIAWMKRRSQYPTFQPANARQTYNIGDRAPVTVNIDGRPRANTNYLLVSSENIYPRGTTWQITRETDRHAQRNVNNSITTQFRNARDANARQNIPPRVAERSGQELARIDLRTFLQADHVKDLNFGGQDEAKKDGNLWPLAANKNNAANAVNHQFVAFKERSQEGTTKSLTSIRKNPLHVKVVYVPGIPASQDAHGTTRERPAGYAELQRIGTQQKSWTPGTSDRYEREADRVADQVAYGNRQRVSSAAGSISCVSASAGSPMQQRESAAESGSTESGLNLESGSGAPMDRGTRFEMEQSFGRDFSGVRIHDNSKSHEMSSSIDARAFTKDSDIYFAQGQYNPSTTSGKHLLAHELTHTVQQGSVIRRQPVETAAATTPSPATQTQDNSPLILGGAPMPGLVPPVEGEMQTPAQVEEQAKAEAGIKKDKKTRGLGEKGKAQGGKAKQKPAGGGEEKEVVKKKEPDEKSSGEQQPKPQPLPLKGGSSDGMLDDFMTSPASKIAASYPALGAGISTTLKAEKKQEADSAPKLVARAGKGKMKAR
ncbi:MAG: DUF4157 domain-containing protein, partial [Desulfobulbaceae bacterium]|nr:DUF4157 domain-containing protein [Desulfobulbaceae bacterium]